MNENLELLEYIYQNAEMAMSSLNDLKKILHGKENHIFKTLDEQLKEYEYFLNESKGLIDELDEKALTLGKMSKIMAYMSMKMEIMQDNSDSKIASMLISGSTMGTIEIEKNIKKYQDKVDKNIINLAKKLLKFEEANIEKLKAYL